MFRIAIAMLAFTALSAAEAQAQETTDWQCTYNDLVRRVEIVYEPGRALPCEVHYFKDVEAPGESQVLWRAENEAGFCAARTDEFIAKLEDQGWACGPQDAQAADDAAEMPQEEEPLRDDTDALAPATDTDEQQ